MICELTIDYRLLTIDFDYGHNNDNECWVPGGGAVFRAGVDYYMPSLRQEVADCGGAVGAV